MKKRILSLLLTFVAFTMALGGLSGCKKEDYDFRVWYPKMTNDYKNLINTPVYQELERRTGVKAKYIIEDSTKLSNLFNQKDIPEVVVQIGQNNYPGGVEAAVRDGNYIDLKPYIDLYAPNYKALMESNVDIYRECFINDGKIGAMYAITDDVQGPWYGYMMRKDLIDDYLTANPATTWTEYPVTYAHWETFLEWIKANKEGFKNPLLLNSDALDPFDCLSAGYGVGRSFYQVDGVVKYGPTEANFKPYIEMLQRWYAKGLIAPDFNAIDALQSMPEVMGTATSDGSYAIFPYIYTSISSFEKTAKMLRPNTKYELIAVPAPVINEGDELHLRQTNQHTGMCISITKNCKDIEKVMKWIDYFYSAEGYILFNYGIEGDSFVYDDSGKPQYTEKMTNTDGLSFTSALYKYVAHSWPFNVNWRREFMGLNEKEIDAMSVWETKNDGAYLIPANIAFNVSESAIVTNKMSSISTFVQEQVPQYVINKNNKHADYDANFTQVLKNMDIQSVIAAYQSALDRYMARDIAKR